MSQHWNIQINIQRVEKEQIPARGMQGPQTERNTVKVLDLAIVADTERDAYAKAHKLLSASEPEWAITVKADGEHLHRASCDDSIGMQICGFPPGPSIADRPV